MHGYKSSFNPMLHIGYYSVGPYITLETLSTPNYS